MRMQTCWRKGCVVGYTCPHGMELWGKVKLTNLLWFTCWFLVRGTSGIDNTGLGTLKSTLGRVTQPASSLLMGKSHVWTSSRKHFSLPQPHKLSAHLQVQSSSLVWLLLCKAVLFLHVMKPEICPQLSGDFGGDTVFGDSDFPHGIFLKSHLIK